MNYDIAKQEGLEALLRAAKNDGYITASQLYEDHKPHSLESIDIIRSIISDRAKIKLFAYKLIERDDKKPGIYNLTMAGLNFNSFGDEDEKVKQDELKKSYDLANAKRVYKSYPLTQVAAWVGAISGLILLIYQLPELYNKLLILIKAIKAGHF